MPRRDPNVGGPASVSYTSASDESSAPTSRSSRWSFSRPDRGSPPIHPGNGMPTDSEALPEDRRRNSNSADSDHETDTLALGPPLIGQTRTTGRRGSQATDNYSPFFPGSYSETLGSIRDDTALLSDMLLSPSAPPIHLHAGGSPHSFASSQSHNRGRPTIRPQQAIPWTSRLLAVPGSQNAVFRGLGSSGEEESDEDDDALSSSPYSNASAPPTPRPTATAHEGATTGTPSPPSAPAASRSILTMLLVRERNDSTASDTTVIAREATATAHPNLTVTSPTTAATDSASGSGSSPQDEAETPRAEVSSARLEFPTTGTSAASDDSSTQKSPSTRRRIQDEESAPLLSNGNPITSYGVASSESSSPPQHGYASTSHFNQPRTAPIYDALAVARGYATPKALGTGVLTTFKTLPAVLLGTLLNILDGVSYGFIIFPAGPVFAGFGSMGVSMFFVTTVISQLVYTFGGSAFPGATSSMIIEVIPFFHIMAAEIVTRTNGEENPHVAVATVMVAFALSSILTGLAFLIFGLLRLGSVIGFFPRHILVGCIGGVGVFLIQTGLSVSAGMGEEDSDLTWRLLKIYFTDLHVLTLWVPAFALAVLLRVITHKYHHQLIFPAYFVALPIIFYIVVFAGGFNVDDLRHRGWVFNVGESRDPWYKFYSYFDFRQTSWSAIWATMPTQLALLFFNVLHPPLNVPALGVSLNEDDVDLSRELTGHGISNLIAGALGAPSNYLAYVNTLLFYRVGGTTRYAGFLLAVATTGLLLVGTGPIAYIPVIEVGALIFVLGIDLVKEAVWDTWPRASRSEYITIIGIMLCMTVYDFVSGVLFGIIVASIFFVIQNSRRHSIRNIFSGATALSPVRRPSAHRKYLQEVGSQTCIMRLQGHIFFGTISRVEDKCRAILDQHAWEHHPIRFLVIDLALVGGLDLSAAEAFVRVQRMLLAKRVILVFCGQPPDSEVAQALQAVGLWSGNVQTFATLNEALEWTENMYLRAWYASPAMKNESPQRTANQAIAVRHVDENFLMAGSFVNSPRRTQVQNVGSKIMDATSANIQDNLQGKEQPFHTIVKTFSSYHSLNDDFVSRLAGYFKSQIVPAGEVIYRQGDQADGLYLIESGVLRATYSFADHVPDVVESCVAGTLSGELSALAGEPRNATVVAERQSVLWKMSIEELNRLEHDYPDDARLFVKLVLKTSKIDQDVLLTNLAQFRA